jgi:oligopeptide/dipeptide ABC transporter ATP-binding protein
MRVGDQIAEAPRHVLGLSARAARARAVDLMRQVGIPDAERRMGAYPHELSGGLRQRVLIAIALSAEPAVLLADEPTTALDVTVQDQILRLLAGIAEERRLAVVLVSHDLAVVSRVCDTVSVMYAGRFVETGPSGALLRLPLHPYTSGLLAAMPERGRGRQMLTPLPGLPPDLAALPPGCAFAPRCRLSEATCSTVRPPLRPSGVDRATACILEPTRPAQATA